ncbi:MAG: sn-glycerol-3-phosphate ABC transporter substrate-binding protein UgpB [Candidatus Rokubacteria bacterium]|nr:sn-glycerol-3-phosphate ABC transporter substrate-binding protein UgpB [Candidatus Rokubacteria bacterium]MBI3108959.1 sn-glycerol-3-phosphate ABC transporter substrate-binding protein UgpB [Candidatus Rokubacteria bacterium]
MRRTVRSFIPGFAALALLAAPLLAPAPALAKTEIHFWHAMGGQLGETVGELVRQFNQSQREYEVKALNKGTYPEVLTAAIAAYRQKNPPHIVQFFDVGTQTMLSSGAIYPVFQLMKEQEVAVNWKDFIAPVVSYYSKDGNLYSMPFNSSSPILYYNKAAFKKAGLDPGNPPATWKQVGEVSKKIIAAGAAKCGFTTSWPSWTMLENTFPWHDQPFATNENGYKGLETKLLINSEFGIKHIGQLAAWQKERVYSYGGRMGQPDPKFVNGDCAMLIQSSAVIGGFKRSVKFDWATGQLPHWGAPYKKQNAIVGGGTLWVMKGQKAGDYKGVAQFLKFISDPHQQMWWSVTTGYVPITQTAIKNLEAGYHFKKNPEQWTALSQLGATPTANSRGHRLGNMAQIRDAIEPELENIFAGKKTTKEGLEAAVAKGNEILKEFAAANKP